jgi:REP-associated tyrosine transposase
MKFDAHKHHRRSIRLPQYDYSQAGAYFVTICAWGREPLFGEICEGEMRLSAAGLIVEAEWKRLAHQFANVYLDAFVVMPNHVHGIIVIHGQVGATRHLPVDTHSGAEPVSNDALTGPDGSPVQIDAPSGVVRATRHLPVDTHSGAEPVSNDALTGPDGSPVQIDAPSGVVRATRHLPADTHSGAEPVSNDALTGPDGSPVRPRGGSPMPKGPGEGSLGAMIGQFKSRATKRIWSLPEYDHVPIWQRNYYEHIIRNESEWVRICEYIQNNPLRWEEDQLHPNAPYNPFNQDQS